MKKILYFTALVYIFSISQHHAMENNGGPSKESQSELLTQIVQKAEQPCYPEPLVSSMANLEERFEKKFQEQTIFFESLLRKQEEYTQLLISSLQETVAQLKEKISVIKQEEIKAQIVLGEGARVPEYAIDDTGAVDLFASETVQINPGEVGVVPTDLRIAVPQGNVAILTGRSGWAYKEGVVPVLPCNLIDAGYTGKINAFLKNGSKEEKTINKGDRCLQMLLVDYRKVRFETVEKLPESARGDGGYGSTGLTSHILTGEERRKMLAQREPAFLSSKNKSE